MICRDVQGACRDSCREFCGSEYRGVGAQVVLRGQEGGLGVRFEGGRGLPSDQVAPELVPGYRPLAQAKMGVGLAIVVVQV